MTFPYDPLCQLPNDRVRLLDRRDQKLGKGLCAFLPGDVAEADDEGHLVIQLDPSLAGVAALVEIGRIPNAGDVYLLVEFLIVIHVQGREDHVSEMPLAV